jgi:hypothetical protein
MVDFAGMSAIERQFVRMYVHSLRRNYALFRSVTDLMNPAGLGVRNVVDATRLADGLADLHDEFETRLRRIQKKIGVKPKIVGGAEPTLDDLADVFSLSFFKVVTTLESDTGAKEVDNNGWFSGKPAEWKKSFLAFQAAAKNNPAVPLPQVLSEIFSAALKLFHIYDKKWSDNPSAPPKTWPPIAAGDDDTYADDEDETSSEGPWDWFFDDES